MSLKHVTFALLFTGCVTDAELNDALDRDGDGFLPLFAGGEDCDETDPAINPDAAELCGDGLDNDCDGVIDDNGVGALTWYVDADEDGYGIEETVVSCEQPTGYAPVAGDCDDTSSVRAPGQDDRCDGIDNDCDGGVDEDAVFESYYADVDGDSYGNPAQPAATCNGVPAHYVTNTLDCDDSDPERFSTAVDLCDGVDNNCDGIVDDAASFTEWYPDLDGDGFGDGALGVRTCDGAPADHVELAGDCDDADPAVVVPLWYIDADADGYGGAMTLSACDRPEGYTATPGDCDDSTTARSPSNTEICKNQLDDDCDDGTDCRWHGYFFDTEADESITLPVGVHRIAAVGDLNGDLNTDYLISNSGSFSILYGEDNLPGTQSVPLPGTCQFPQYEHNAPYADVSGDGVPEISCAVNNDLVVYNGANPTEIFMTVTGSASIRSSLLTTSSITGPGVWIRWSGGDDVAFYPASAGDVLEDASTVRFTHAQLPTIYSCDAVDAILIKVGDLLLSENQLRYYDTPLSAQPTLEEATWNQLWTDSDSIGGFRLLPVHDIDGDGCGDMVEIRYGLASLPPQASFYYYPGPFQTPPSNPVTIINVLPDRLSQIPVFSFDYDGDGNAEWTAINYHDDYRSTQIFYSDTPLPLENATPDAIHIPGHSAWDSMRSGFDFNQDGIADFTRIEWNDEDPTEPPVLVVFYGNGP